MKCPGQAASSPATTRAAGLSSSSIQQVSQEESSPARTRAVGPCSSSTHQVIQDASSPAKTRAAGPCYSSTHQVSQEESSPAMTRAADLCSSSTQQVSQEESSPARTRAAGPCSASNQLVSIKLESVWCCMIYRYCALDYLIGCRLFATALGTASPLSLRSKSYVFYVSEVFASRIATAPRASRSECQPVCPIRPAPSIFRILRQLQVLQ